MWTHFSDLHSVGGVKVVLQRDGTFQRGRTGQPIEHIYIEAPEEEAKVIFYNRFGHDPEHASCTCCASDYSISTDESLEQLTAYHRHCKRDNEGKYIEQQNEDSRQYIAGAEDEKVWQEYLNRRGNAARYMTLAQYSKQPNVLIIPASNHLERNAPP